MLFEDQSRSALFSHTVYLWCGLLLFCLSLPLLAAPNVDVNIRGVEGELLTNVQLLLSIQQQRGHPLLSAGRIKRLHQKAEEEIRTALKPYGYYRAEIDARLDRISEESWRAEYVIDPGEPLRLASVTVELRGDGRDTPELSQAFSNFPLQRGDVLNQVRYEAAKSDIVQSASELGFFESTFIRQRILINLEQYNASIELEFDSGPRYHFGEIHLNQDVLEEDFLRRFIPFERGEPYRVSELIALQQALSNSDYFHDIEIEPDTSTNSQHAVPVSVKLTPRKRHKYTIGIGYGSDTKARAKLGWAIPRVNRYGHRFDSEIKVSGISKSVSANYHIPIGDPTTEEVAFNAAVVDTTTDTSDSLVRNIGVSLVQTPGPWRRVLSLNYQDETFTIADESGRSKLLIPGADWSRVWADDIADVVNGMRLQLGVRGASDAVLSDTNFTQATLSAKLIRSFLGSNRIILRGRAGSTWTQAFNELPASVRFFTGGSQSVRGFSYQSLGPVNDQGRVVGGKHLLVGSVELEHSLNKNWAVAVFYDQGNAINNMDDPLEYGAGFGLRWQTPIGPVRLDLASALSQPGEPWRIHINVGPDL